MADPTVKASDIFQAAYRMIGIVSDAGRGYTASQQTEAISVLQTLLDSWRIQPYTAFAEDRTLFTLTGAASYTLGESGADVTMQRPIEIKQAGILLNTSTPAVEAPVKVLLDQEWDLIPVKSLTSTIVNSVYYKPTMPLGTLYVYPVCTTAHQLVLYTYRNIPMITAASDTMSLPPGYRAALETVLAMRLASMNPNRAIVSPDLRRQHAAAMRWVKAQNAEETLMRGDAGSGIKSGGGWNILTNRWN